MSARSSAPPLPLVLPCGGGLVKGWFCERDLRDARLEYGEGGMFWVRVPVKSGEALAALEALGRGVTPGYVVRSEVSIVEREG